jgi:hypothetical protein
MLWILATGLERPFLDQPHIFMLKSVGSCRNISEICMSESSVYQQDTDKIQRTEYAISSDRSAFSSNISSFSISQTHQYR